MDKYIHSIQEFVDAIKEVASTWDLRTTPWFRGEPFEEDTPLLPSLYRPLPNGKKYNENRILQSFRRMGPAFTGYKTPDRNAIDEWLFLMQHLRVPTRLLDWSEGVLIGLYFALEHQHPVVWMLNPDELNQLSATTITPGVYPLTWYRPENGTINIGHENIRGAWEEDRKGMDLPVAIKPTYIHPRMSAQKSCFTVHGKKKEPISKLVSDRIVVRFVLDETFINTMRQDLIMLGITHTSVFPEAEYLAKELKETAVT
jgi:FRG domain